MYECELKELKEKVESIKNLIPCKVRLTTQKSPETERQLVCPNFKIYMSGDGENLTRSSEILFEICKERKWEIKRLGHRDFEIDVNPLWTKMGKRV